MIFYVPWAIITGNARKLVLPSIIAPSLCFYSSGIDVMYKLETLWVSYCLVFPFIILIIHVVVVLKYINVFLFIPILAELNYKQIELLKCE